MHMHMRLLGETRYGAFIVTYLACRQKARPEEGRSSWYVGM